MRLFDLVTLIGGKLEAARWFVIGATSKVGEVVGVALIRATNRYRDSTLAYRLHTLADGYDPRNEWRRRMEECDTVYKVRLSTLYGKFAKKESP